jgi:branched-chain amino acid transport system ATP-binding protein
VASAAVPEPLLRLSDVQAFYGPVQVLFDIDLEVGDGEIVALLGTNGAGKTTILRIVSGILQPVAGEVTWKGASLRGVRPADIVRAGIVQMPGGRGVFPGLSVQENLEMGGFLLGRDKAARREAIDRVLEDFPALKDRRRQVAGSMSGGQQQMLTLAKSFVMRPKLLLVDELSLGLAPKVVEDLIEILQRFNREGLSILLVDQHVDLALDVADRAYFIERGEIRFSGPSSKLRGRDDLLRSLFLRGETGSVANKPAPRRRPRKAAAAR